MCGITCPDFDLQLNCLEIEFQRENRQSLIEVANGALSKISDDDLEKVFDWLYDVIQEAG